MCGMNKKLGYDDGETEEHGALEEFPGVFAYMKRLMGNQNEVSFTSYLYYT